MRYIDSKTLVVTLLRFGTCVPCRNSKEELRQSYDSYTKDTYGARVERTARRKCGARALPLTIVWTQLPYCRLRVPCVGGKGNGRPWFFSGSRRGFVHDQKLSRVLTGSQRARSFSRKACVAREFRGKFYHFNAIEWKSGGCGQGFKEQGSPRKNF